MEPILLGAAEKHFIAQGFADGVRNDGRGIDDFRPIWIESPAFTTTNGSARVKIDTTDILVGVKCEVMECEDTSLTPNRLQFTVEPSCIAALRTEAKGGELLTEAIEAVLMEAYHGNGDVITNMEKLVLCKQFMWKVYVDIVIQQYGGNILDAIFIAVKAALLDTRITNLALIPQDEGKFSIECEESTETNFFRLEAANAPLSISVNQIGKSIAVDCTEVEEVLLRTALWVVMDQPENERTPDDSIRLRVAKQMFPGGMDPRSIPAMLDLAVRSGRKLHAAVNARLEEIKNADGSQVPATYALQLYNGSPIGQFGPSIYLDKMGGNHSLVAHNVFSSYFGHYDRTMCKVLLVLLALVCPPLAVLLDQGCTCALCINIILTCLLIVPGIIHAIIVILAHNR